MQSIPGWREAQSMAGSIEQQRNCTPREELMTFRPLAHADLPLILRWLNTPAVQEWWDDRPTSIDELEGKHVPRIDGSERVYGYIAAYDGEPFGFLQWYRLATEQEHVAVGLVDPGAAAIDLYIGEERFLHRGYGPVMIRAFLRAVVFAEPDVTACAIDPVVSNTIAISAYRKVGFRDIAVRYSPYEKADSLVMVIDRSELMGE
jgi:aminoglycoside 6'-N-acetyltransferase